MSGRQKRRKIFRNNTCKREILSVDQLRNKVMKFLDEKMRFMEVYFTEENEEAFLIDTFDTLSKEDRIKRILYHQKDERKRSEFIEALRKVQTNSIRSLFKESFNFFGELPSKLDVVKSIISKFYEEEPEIFRRGEEEENLEGLTKNDFRNLQSVEFGSHYVPVDLIILIFSYLDYDSSLLKSVGFSCKGFYLTILCTWPRVVLTKWNIYKTSILVLRNVKEVIFTQHHSQGSFIQRDWYYLFSHLSENSRLRKITIDKNVGNIYKDLRFFEKFLSKDESSTPFPHVVEFLIRFADRTGGFYEKVREMGDGDNFQIRHLFPNLESFINVPVNLGYLEGLKLKTIGFTEPVLQHLSHDQLSKIDFSRLENLSFQDCPGGYFQYESRLVSKIERVARHSKDTLRSLELCFDWESRPVSFGFLEDLPCLEDVYITTLSTIDPNTRWHKVWYRGKYYSLYGIPTVTKFYPNFKKIQMDTLTDIFFDTEFCLDPELVTNLITHPSNIQNLRIAFSFLLGEENEPIRDHKMDQLLLSIPSSRIPGIIHIEIRNHRKVRDGPYMRSKDSHFFIEKKKKSMGEACGVVLGEYYIGETKRTVDKLDFFNEYVLERNLKGMIVDSNITQFSFVTREHDMNMAVNWLGLDKLMKDEMKFEKEEDVLDFHPGSLMVNGKFSDPVFFVGYYDHTSGYYLSRPDQKRRFIRQDYVLNKNVEK